MVRSPEAVDFHKQLLKESSHRLVELGFFPIQHCAVEGAGRPDLVGKTTDGKFQIIVECKVRQPTLKELEELPKKYAGRDVVLAVQTGTEFDFDYVKRLGYKDVWTFPMKDREGNVLLPIGILKVSESIFEKIRSKHPAEEETNGMWPPYSFGKRVAELLEEHLSERKGQIEKRKKKEKRSKSARAEFEDFKDSYET